MPRVKEGVELQEGKKPAFRFGQTTKDACFDARNNTTIKSILQGEFYSQ
jgi:hypothetical protein